MHKDKVMFMTDMLKINSKYIFQNVVRIAEVLYSLVTIILAFASWEELGAPSLSGRISALLAFLGISFLAGGVYTVLLQKSRNLWRRGGRSIHVRYLDLIKIAFRKDNSGKKLIVIPVNTSFDTIVDDDPNQKAPLVSPTSLHGQWIRQMNRHGVSVEELDKRIENYLRENCSDDITYVKRPQGRGNEFSYPYGTIVAMGEGDVVFLLLAISKFNDRNVAESDRTQLRTCLEKLIKFYHDKGQGFDLYIPLMGTTLCGADLSYTEALEMITSALRLYHDKLRGRVNVVIYPGNRDAVTIFDI